MNVEKMLAGSKFGPIRVVREARTDPLLGHGFNGGGNFKALGKS
jgi:hypothetical protein